MLDIEKSRAENIIAALDEGRRSEEEIIIDAVSDLLLYARSKDDLDYKTIVNCIVCHVPGTFSLREEIDDGE